MSLNQDELSEEIYHAKYLKYKNKYLELSRLEGGWGKKDPEKEKKKAELKAAQDLVKQKKSALGRNKFLTQKCWTDETKFKVEKGFKTQCLKCSLEGSNPGIIPPLFKCCVGYKQMWTILKQGGGLDLQRLCKICNHAFGYHGAITGGDGEIKFRSLKEKLLKGLQSSLNKTVEATENQNKAKMAKSSGTPALVTPATETPMSTETPATETPPAYTETPIATETPMATETPATETPATETEEEA